MNRRKFLTSCGVSSAIALAGCSSDERDVSTNDGGNDIQDSDGDGVIDSEDYAPQDPEVQEKKDIVTPVARATATEGPATPDPTPTPAPTRTPTPEPNVSANTIVADYERIQTGTVSYFESYSLTEAEITFKPSEIDDVTVQDRMRIITAIQEYPNGEIYELERSDAFRVGDSATTITVSYDFTDAVDSANRFYLQAFLMPPTLSMEEAFNQERVAFLNETDRLSLTGDQLRKDQHPDAKTTLETDRYERIAGEGTYLIRVSGEEDFSMVVYKHGYIQRKQRDFQRAISVARGAYREGISQSLAAILHDNATDNGYTSKRGKVDYAVAAIQSFPYVSDDVTDGYDAYNKWPTETIVEAGGDCEDTVILLASALFSKPYGYGTSLLYLPPDSSTHMALGVAGEDDVRGYYYEYDGTRYYYTETTGQGWSIGEKPAAYDGVSARVVPL